jgi:hypothetical protein
VVLRCVNLTDEEISGQWVLGIPGHSASLARLDETPLEPLELVDGAIAFSAAPRALVTILLT